MATLASLLVKLGVDTRTVKSSLDKGTKDAEHAGRKTGKRYSSGFGREVGAGVVAGVAVAWAQSTVRALGEIERLRKQTETALTSMNVAWTDVKGIEAYAASIEKVTGVEAETVQTGQNLLLTFGNIRNEVGAGNAIFDRATMAATDMSVALGQDMKSSAVQLGKALNDPIAGVSALQRVGVSFTAAQKDQIKALVASGDVMGAQKLILAELEKQFGGSAKAFGETMPGQLAKARNQFGELSENLVTNVLPALNTLIQFGLANMGWLVPAAGVILAVVVAIKLVTIAQIAWNLAMLANPIGLVIIAIVALVAVIVFLATKTRFFQTIWNTVWGGIKAAAAAVGGWFAGPFAGFFTSLFGKITGGVTAARNWVVSTFLNLVSFVAGLPARMAAAAAGMFDGIRNAFRGAVNWVIRAWNNLSFTLPSVTVLGQRFGGFTLSTPNIPLLQTGGVVVRTGLAVVHRGEQVMPAQAAPLANGGREPLVIRLDGTDEEFKRFFRAILRRNRDLLVI